MYAAIQHRKYFEASFSLMYTNKVLDPTPLLGKYAYIGAYTSLEIRHHVSHKMHRVPKFNEQNRVKTINFGQKQ